MSTKKRMASSRRPFACLLAAWLGAAAAHALVPQPLCTFYGMAVDDYGWPYLSDASVVLRIDGEEYARCEIDGIKAPGVNFVLRVPLDSSVGQRYSIYSTTSGVPIQVVIEADGWERTIMETNALPRVGNPGDVIAINITAGDDTDHDGLPDTFERWIIYNSWSDQIFSLADVRPDDDFDGDGASNFREMCAGTDPAWNLDIFAIEEMTTTSNGRLKFSFWTVPGKSYSVVSTLDLAGPAWMTCLHSPAVDGPLVDGYVPAGGEYMSLYVQPATNRCIFRLKGL